MESRNKVLLAKINSKESTESILQKNRRSIEFIESLTPVNLHKPRIQDLLRFKFDANSQKLKQNNAVPDNEIFKEVSPIKNNSIKPKVNFISKIKDSKFTPMKRLANALSRSYIGDHKNDFSKQSGKISPTK